ncbi:MAG: UDP-N-acetylmuramoyl-tripeptide--D-alanyl-D-alanine ligase [Bariatricus sp.]
MKHMTIQNITEACHGTFCGNAPFLEQEVQGVAIDSRKIKPGYLFVPIKGAKVDGHTFIPQVMENGALVTLTEHPLDEGPHPYILVDSCEQALKDIAAFYRNALDIKVVGITGSVGKTSTKETIASVLSQKYNVLKTEGNFNNEIGLPLTIFNIREEHEVAVLEMGIDHFGEMHRLASISQPDICVITNIGLAHMENLGSRDGILKAKTEVFDHLKPNACVILNGDDDKLCTVSSVQGKPPVFFGLSPEQDAYADEIENLGLRGTKCTLHLSAGSIRVHIPVPGEHMIYNALAAACTGLALGLTPEEIKAGIESLKTISGRTNLIETDSLLIIDDCYNANPISMKSSLDVLATASGRKVAIMGDMFELGPNECELHYNTGSYAAEKQIDIICCIGKLSRHAYSGAKAHATQNIVLYFETRQEFLEKIQNVIQKGDTILVKASHSMEFPEIVSALKEMKLR